MKSLMTLGLISIAFTFCGLQERLKSLTGTSNVASNTANSGSNANSPNGAVTAEKAVPSAAQEAIIDSGKEIKWDEQGLSWRMPAGWKKISVSKDGFNYMSPDNAFLLVNIATLADSFPAEVSLRAYHKQALQQLKIGKYESVKMVEIDGISGVEFIEAPPAGKDDPRRHQWIAYRKYLGQTQQLNVMTSTKASNFSKHLDDFPAVLYSMKAVK